MAAPQDSHDTHDHDSDDSHDTHDHDSHDSDGTREPLRHLAAVWSSLDDLLSQLRPEDWRSSTECPGWTVQDQVSHLIGTESMLLGRSAPAPVDGPHVHNPIGQVNEGWVAERRSRPPDEVMAEFRDVTSARRAALAAMTDDELLAPTDGPTGRVPYAEFMRLRVMDSWVHEQDIRRAVGRPGNLEGPVAASALARFTRSLGFVVGKRAGAAEGESVVVHLEAPGTRESFGVTVVDGRAQPATPPERPTATLTMTPETYACLSSGRWVPDDVLADGRVKIEGDADLAGRVLAGMSILP